MNQKTILPLLGLLLSTFFVFGQNPDTIGIAQRVDSLIKTTQYYCDQQNFEAAFANATQAEQLAIGSGGKESFEYGRASGALGMVLFRKGENNAASKYLQESKAIFEKMGMTKHPEYAADLFFLGCIAVIGGKLQAGEALLSQSVALRETVLGKLHKDYGESLRQLAFAYISLRNNSKAQTTLDTYDTYCAEKDGLKSADYAEGLSYRARLNQQMGDYEKAETNFLECIEIFKTVYGNSNFKYAMNLNYLALLYFQMGDEEKSEPLYEKAYNILKSQSDRASSYVGVIQNFATLYAYGETQRFDKAEALYQEALTLNEQLYGKESPQYALNLCNMGGLYYEMGNYTKDLQLQMEAKLIREKTIGKQNFSYILSMNNLGGAYMGLKDYENAKLAYQEGLDIAKTVLGVENYRYVTLLFNVANNYNETGDYDKALPLYIEAKEKFEKILGKQDISYNKLLYQLGHLYFKKRDFEKSELYLLEAYQLAKENFGIEHTQLGQIINYLGDLYFVTNELEKCEAFVLEANESSSAQLLNAIQFQSENELLGMLKQQIFDPSRDYTLAQRKGDLGGFCYDQALFYKGFVLNAVSKVGNLAQSTPELATLYHSFQKTRFKLSKEYAQSFSDRDSAQIATLESQANTLEKELIKKVRDFDELKHPVKWKEIQAKLQPNEAAIEFVDYEYIALPSSDSVMYAAIILRPGNVAPLFVPLFEKKSLLSLLQGATGGNNFLKINAVYLSKSSTPGQKSLYELIWKPLETSLQGVSTVYFSPAGLLHYLNLAAIATPDGTTIGLNRNLVQLGSTRNLITGTKTSVAPNNAFLAGGIRYETDQNARTYSLLTRSTNATEIPSFQSDSSLIRGEALDYLPATATEVNEIGKMLRQAGVNTKVDTGYFATEEQFRSLGINTPSPRIIHLATHGYFFPNPKGKIQKRTISSIQEPVFKMSEHPMIRSGLIMAGAKQAWLTGKHPEGQEDGILTAYEISQMNLSNTELVVLSACETGLGQVSGNEGVYGLQRAFKIAGVKYLIMSLWKVDDRSTKAFMTEFYRQWLQGKQPIPQAFRSAQQAMRTKNPNPYDWAGFVLIE